MATALAVLGLWIAAGGLREDIDNPQYKQWSKFKPGAFVKYKMSTEAAGNKSESEMSMKLVELTGEKAVVETAIVFGGNALPGTKQEIPAKIKKLEGQAGDAPKPKEGEEEIVVGGKKVKTKWVETTVEQGGSKSVTQAWMSEEIPGGLARSETKSAAVNVVMVVAEWKKE